MIKKLNRLIIRRKSIKVSNEEFFVDNGEQKIMADILLEKKKKHKKYDDTMSFMGGGDTEVGFDEEGENVKGDDVDEKQEEQEVDVAINEELNNTMVVEDIPIETIPVHEEKVVEPTTAIEEEHENNNIEEVVVENKPPKPEYDFSKLAESEYNKGFEAGKKSAMEMMENEFKKKLFSSVKGLFTLTENMRKEFNEYKSTMDDHIITVALAIASKVIKEEVSIKKETVISQLKAAINKITGVNSFVVYINPKDEEILRLYKNDIINKFDSIKDFSIQVNEKIDVGGCRLESQVGNVDAKIESQLSVIEEALRENIKSYSNAT